MKRLLVVTAVVEAGVGLALLAIPAATVSLLLGVPLDSPGGLIAGRIAGAALCALSIAAATDLIAGLLFYNLGTVATLLYAALRLKFDGVLLWPAVVAHSGLAVWCLVSLIAPKSNG
jgi:hypothetical protein